MSETSKKSKHPSYPGTPRWVKVSGIIFILSIVAVAVLHLTGNSPFGNHMAMIQHWLQQLWH